MGRRYKHNDKALARKRDAALTAIEEAIEPMPLAQAKDFLVELVEDLNLKLDVINSGEVE